MVRVFLQDVRQQGQRVVVVALVGEARGLASEELEVVRIEDEAVLEARLGLRDLAEVQQDLALRREGGAVARVQAERVIESLQRLLRPIESGQGSPRAFQVERSIGSIRAARSRASTAWSDRPSRSNARAVCRNASVSFPSSSRSRSPASTAALWDPWAMRRSRRNRTKSARSGARDAAFVIAARASRPSPTAFARRARRAQASGSFGSAVVRRTQTSRASFVRPRASNAELRLRRAVGSFGLERRTVWNTGTASSNRWSSIKQAP